VGKENFQKTFCERSTILKLKQEENKYFWANNGGVWVQVVFDGKKNLFSAVGAGVRNGVFTMRLGCPVGMENALFYRGKHYFITNIKDLDRFYMEVTAAEVEPTPCSYMERIVTWDEYNRPVEKDGETIAFPACITEKYAGFSQNSISAESEVTLVMVTPKVIDLPVGGSVQIGDKPFYVEAAHNLDAYKNEYEISQRRDV